MEKYYKSYNLKSFNEVDIYFIKEMQFGVKVFTPPALNIKIGEVIDDRYKVSFVIYYDKRLSDKIKDYHKEKYGENILLGICEDLPNGTKISFYRDNKILKYSIDIYHDDGKPKIRQEFNENFELVEYYQSVYNADGEVIQEKVFYADSWTIHVEKML